MREGKKRIGADEVIMSYKLTRGTVDSAKDLVERLDQLEKKVSECFPEVRWQFIYPVPS